MPYGSHTIAAGDAGTFQTLGFMRALSRDGAVDPIIRTVAARVVRFCPNTDEARAVALRRWVAQVTQFLPDPSIAEALVPPADTLALIARDGVAQIDCDDVAILAAALGLSIGLLARFTVVAFDPTPGAAFAHVFAELGSPDGSGWLTVDPARPTINPPQFTRIASIEV